MKNSAQFSNCFVRAMKQDKYLEFCFLDDKLGDLLDVVNELITLFPTKRIAWFERGDEDIWNDICTTEEQKVTDEEICETDFIFVVTLE